MRAWHDAIGEIGVRLARNSTRGRHPNGPYGTPWLGWLQISGTLASAIFPNPPFSRRFFKFLKGMRPWWDAQTRSLSGVRCRSDNLHHLCEFSYPDSIRI